MAIQLTKADYDLFQKMSNGNAEAIVEGARQRGMSEDAITQGLQNKINVWKSQGYSIEPKEEPQSWTIDRQETRADRNRERAIAALSSFAAVPTMGLSDVAIRAVAGEEGAEQVKEAREAHPAYSIVSGLGGAVLPVGAVSGAMKLGKLAAGKATAKMTSKAWKWGVEKSIQGAILGAETYVQEKMEQLAETRDWNEGATVATEALDAGGTAGMYILTDMAMSGLGAGGKWASGLVKRHVGTRNRAVQLAGGKENLATAQMAAKEIMDNGGTSEEVAGTFFRTLSKGMNVKQRDIFGATISRSPDLQKQLYEELSAGLGGTSKIGEAMKGEGYHKDLAGQIDKFLGSEYINSYGAHQIGLGTDNLARYMGVGDNPSFKMIEDAGKAQAQNTMNLMPAVFEKETRNASKRTFKVNEALRQETIKEAQVSRFANLREGANTPQRLALDEHLQKSRTTFVVNQLKDFIAKNYPVSSTVALLPENIMKADSSKQTVLQILSALEENGKKMLNNKKDLSIILQNAKNYADQANTYFSKNLEGGIQQKYAQEYTKNLMDSGSSNIDDIYDLKNLAKDASGKAGMEGLATDAGTYDVLINHNVLETASPVLGGAIKAKANASKVEAARMLGEKLKLSDLSKTKSDLDLAISNAGSDGEKAILLTGFTLGLRKKLATDMIKGNKLEVHDLISAMSDKDRLGKYISTGTKDRILEDTKDLVEESKALYNWIAATEQSAVGNELLTNGIRVATALAGGARVAAQNSMLTTVKNLGFGPKAMKQIMEWAENPTSKNFLKMLKGTSADTIERSNMQKALRAYWNGAKDWLKKNPGELLNAYPDEVKTYIYRQIRDNQ